MYCFENVRILQEEEGSLGVDAEEEESIDGVDDLIADVAMETHYEMFDLSHHWIQFGTFQIGDVQ